MTKAEREALEALAESYRCSMSLEVAACGEELRALLATLDKPATRYPWADAPEWAMWAATDSDGEMNWFEIMPEPHRKMWDWGFDVSAKYQTFRKGWLGGESHNQDWRDSLETRPDAP